MSAEHHKKGTVTERNRNKHEEGQARKARDRGGEKGDARRKNYRKPIQRETSPDISFVERLVFACNTVGCFAICLVLVADDMTVAGVADDPIIVPTVLEMIYSVSKAFS